MAKFVIPANGDSEHTVGGHPSAAADFEWPTCTECSAAMQFLAQLPLGEHDDPKTAGRTEALLLFQCQGDPGMCDEWDADSGGNAARLVSLAGRVPIDPPAGQTTLSGRTPIAFEIYDDSRADEYDDDAYVEASATRQDILGKIGGRPEWIQGDETPQCSCCDEPMTYFGQLEDRGGGGINFGDAGNGYAFVCGSCVGQAKFLWQCG